ncbi:MAG: hypothetical protein HKL81_09310 [Acidimicrobiaceae bacterium]|nr:hypothetical protein [Acidimicrobiaceae bacterium]
MDRTIVREALIARLSNGPANRFELKDHLLDLGLIDDKGLGEEILDYLEDADLAWESEAGNIALLPFLVNQIHVGHRLSVKECELKLIDRFPDLELLWISNGNRYSIDHELIEVGFGGPYDPDKIFPNGYAKFPERYFDGLEPGELIHFYLQDETISIVRGASLSDPATASSALRDAFDYLYEPGVGVSSIDIELDASCNSPHAFDLPLPPLADLLDMNGLEILDGEIGPKDEAWVSSDQEEEEIDRLFFTWRHRFSLDNCCLLALADALSIWENSSLDTIDTATISRLADSLDHGNVLPAFAAWLLEPTLTSTLSIADAILYLEKVRGPGRATALTILAYFLASSNIDTAESYLRLAIKEDSEHPWARRLLSQLLEDRGDLQGALSNLNHSTSGEMDDDRGILEALVEEYSGLARNEPCPCGSGKKYKRCCLVSPKLPLDPWRQWFESVMTRFASFPGNGSALNEIIGSAVYMEESPGIEAFWPFSMDLAIHEGGSLKSYLTNRRGLIPPHQLTALEKIALTRRSIYEIVASTSQSLTLRDIRTNEMVSALRCNGDYEIGQTILCRIADFEGDPIVLGSVSILRKLDIEYLLPLTARGLTVDDLLLWFHVIRPLAEITSLGGDPLVACQASLFFSDPSDVPAKLNSLFEVEGVNEWSISATNTDSVFIPHGVLQLVGKELRVDANTEPYFDHLLAIIQENFSGFEVKEEKRSSIIELLRQGVPPDATDKEEATPELQDYPEK